MEKRAHAYTYLATVAHSSMYAYERPQYGGTAFWVLGQGLSTTISAVLSRWPNGVTGVIS